jgi:hypothetical protein
MELASPLAVRIDYPESIAKISGYQICTSEELWYNSRGIGRAGCTLTAPDRHSPQLTLDIPALALRKAVQGHYGYS